ncbi:hypothetical protein BHU72_12705 [Desulfuribacillus stibiiarsenatis]|uniref:Uncharacterized protein n=1 Tax=Desulfuribacillus stibiiarsenatis TaxID=1390249 RepID=A0A1E5L902_9FIRM|nr:HD-GYP domain-containing protein [Desulfuribacillus stibiiarsenatis]OEH86469.1 hypothetical protein BHU72_12705 [Desulfuribacillus stibiiarsenatis]
MSEIKVDIKVDQLKPGLQLAENVTSPMGGVILYKGSRTEDYHKELLQAFTIETVKVIEEKKSQTPLKVPEKKASDKIPSTTATVKNPLQIEMEKNYNQAVSVIKNIMLQVEYTKKVPLLEIRTAIKPLLEQVCEQPKISLVMNQLRAAGEYTYKHSIGVGIISTVIARFLNYKDNELMQIGLAGTLHDIGKAKISNDILMKKGPLNHDQYNEIKKHPIYSYEILEKVTGINQGVVLAALEHHEREDGKGYPYGRKGFETHPYSKIVAVADIFHAMTSNREYKEADNIYHVLKQISEDAFGKLDPNVVTKFVSGLMDYCIGKTVILSNEMVGEIILINNSAPLKPLVKVENNFIDLSRRSDVHITHLSIEL